MHARVRRITRLSLLTFGLGLWLTAPSRVGAQLAPLRFIHEVQGTGPGVAIAGPVTLAGIVTARFERADVLDGFFLQEEDVDADASPLSSEGIFVFCRSRCPLELGVGDAVTVSGAAVEFFGMSQLDASATGGTIQIDSRANPLPTPVPASLPAPGSTELEGTFEALEGMLVEFPGKLVVSEYFELSRYGQLVLTAGERPHQFTHDFLPSGAGYAAFLAELDRSRIILDDDDNGQNDAVTGALDEPYYHPSGGLSLGNRFRGGDSISGLTGVLHWSFAGQAGTDAWRVRPVPERFTYTFVSENPRPTAPERTPGQLRVASFNVLNYFTTLDQGGAVCGPSALECRGADSAAELERQRDKIVAALAAIDADVVGLIEIENDAGTALADLVLGLDAVMGAGSYDVVDTGSIGSDAIQVAFLYKPASVALAGNFAILDSSVDPRFRDDRNRPALIQSFDELATGERFTVAVNHLKSKGSTCDDIGDPDLNDGQGNCNVTRTTAAAALIDDLARDPTASGDGDVLIIGDLNSHRMEDPIRALVNAGYTDLVSTFGGEAAYSYVFDGQLGYLDHALANASLSPQVRGVAVWHINADEPPAFDYEDAIRDESEAAFERKSSALPLYAPDAYRASDHDPLIIDLALGTPPRLECAPWFQ